MLQGLDIASQLASLQAAVEKLHRQNASRDREHEELRLRTELRLQQIEQRYSTYEDSLAMMDDRIGSLEQQTLEQIEDIRENSKSMMSLVVSRIADQFDAVQATIDEMTTRGENDTKAQHAAMESLENKMARNFDKQDNSMEAFKKDVYERLHQESVKLNNNLSTEIKESICTLEENLKQDWEMKFSSIQKNVEKNKVRNLDLQNQIDIVNEKISKELEANKAAMIAEMKDVEGRHLQSFKELQDALTLWQDTLEEKIREITGNFDQYKQYVRRLRTDIKNLKEENNATALVLTQAISKELDGNLGSSLHFQQDLAGLIGQFHESIDI